MQQSRQKHGKPATEPKLSLAELDRAIGAFLIGTYNVRVHREIRVAPQAGWSGNGWLPRMPNSLEELDLLLISVAKARTVHRDGIHFQEIRYMDPTLAAYVKEAVTIQYDPRDVAEIRVFHRNRFLCRKPRALRPSNHLKGYPNRTLGSPPSASWTDQGTRHAGGRFPCSSH